MGRFQIVIFLCLCPLLAMSQSHDFVIKDFHENTTDLTAVSSNVKDLNGKTAALIRFAVRDTLFSFEANNGIIEQKKVVGEVQLFVPHGTKRITVRHPNLGILRDYQLPLLIESKTTYDAEIVITNAEYLRKLIGFEQRPVETNLPKTAEPKIIQKGTIEEESIADDLYFTKKPRQKKTHISPDVHFLLGGGYNALSVIGPSFLMGFLLDNVMISADYTIGVQKVEGVGIYYKKETSGDIGEAYNYKASRFSVRLGVGNPKASVQVIPTVGLSLNMIKGDEIVNHYGSKAQFSESTPTSLSLALILRIRLFGSLHLAVIPQYDIAIGADDVYKVIKSADSKIQAWGEGFGINAGVLLRF